jgi:hypothetical protein
MQSVAPSAVEKLPLGPEKWLTRPDPRHPPGVHYVSCLLPAGYDTYLRIFNRFEPWDWQEAGLPSEPTPKKWRELAAEAGVVYHPEIMWASLRPILGGKDGPRAFQVDEGDLDDKTRDRLFAQLAASTDELAYFYVGLAAWVGDDDSILFRAPVSAIDDIRHQAEVELGGRGGGGVSPEYVWPEGRAWVLQTDFDLNSSYLACPRDLAASIAADADIESLPVIPRTRVDGGADLVNGTGYLRYRVGLSFRLWWWRLRLGSLIGRRTRRLR